jgi:hypothetical protein
VGFPARWTPYLNSVSAAGLAQTSFSLLFLELIGYCVNAVRRHVTAAEWRTFFDLAAQSAGDGLWSVPFNPAHPLSTPRGLNSSLPAVQHALADAVQFFQANRIALDTPLGAAQQYAGIPLHGCTDLEGCFAVIEPGGALAANGTYPDVNLGSSFIMTVELTPAGPRSRTILTYSESANTALPSGSPNPRSTTTRTCASPS